jgi:hypothetical protein
MGNLLVTGFDVNQNNARIRYCIFCEKYSEYIAKRQTVITHFVGESTLNPRGSWLGGLP